jgi:hypothetical protein
MGLHDKGYEVSICTRLTREPEDVVRDRYRGWAGLPLAEAPLAEYSREGNSPVGCTYECVARLKFPSRAFVADSCAFV